MRTFLRNTEGDLQIWPSYTDVALNVILILLFYVFAQSVISSQTSAEMKKIKDQQQRLEQAVVAAIPEGLGRDISVRSDGSLQRYTFADRVLFDSGRAELKESGQELLRLLGGVLKQQVDTFSRIQIEGHTDDQPITRGFASNWELSSARATSVVRFFGDSVGLDPKILSATGYSQYHPVENANTDAARARNRRIEVVVVYSEMTPR